MNDFASFDLHALTAALRARLIDALAAGDSLPDALGLLVAMLAGSHGVPLGLLFLAAVLGAGFGLAFLVQRRLKPLLARLAAEQDTDLWRCAAAIGTAVLRLLIAAAFALGSAVALVVVMPDWHELRVLTSNLALALFYTLVIRIIADLAVAPEHADRRPVPLDDQAAKWIRRRVMAAAATWTFGFAVSGALLVGGIDHNLYTLLTLIVAATVYLQAMLLVHALGPLTLASRRSANEATPGGGLSAEAWRIVAMVLLTLIFVMKSIRILHAAGLVGLIGPSLASLLLLVVFSISDYWLVRLFDLIHDDRGQKFAARLRPLVRVVFYATGLWLLLALWGLDAVLLNTLGIGGWIIGALLKAAVALVVADVLWQAIKMFAHTGKPDTAEAMGAEIGGMAKTRLETVMPLVRNFLLVSLAVIAVLVVLSDLGVDILPLLAGAGVVGLAIGFGSQTLVKDVVTGLFFLLEDAFRLGEYIDVGVAKGTVEAISIRSMKLRHHRGPLNTVPFGAVGTLTNHSRDWVVVKLRFRVTYDTDPAKVKRIVKSIGAELAADPEYGLFFLQPLKSQGVIEMDEFGMIVSVKYTTRPGDQFTIRREVYQRIRAAFDEAGIQFASRANLLALAGQEPETKKATAE